MDIPNLSQTPTSAGRVKIINPAFLIIMLVLGVAAGFGLSRIAPTKTASSPIDNNKNSNLVTGIEDKKDIEDILAIPLLGVIPESTSVLTSSNSGSPVISDKNSDAGSAYDDLVARFLGEERPHRFLNPEKKGLFAWLLGS